uniref:26S proteasome non-ATPase regulatory subunit 2 homolog n=1 Tax=Trieres chinensis TaxID=1514140 RepID=A0A7S2EGD7_TRICV|mmetsp:Transcript_22665/g.45923  ORF Transcript_22665/g.45923 Transcript_22665/m.45923 type:complete len:933 (+) Transcript_22665:103-2901(+)|eukprot:CAMPEP_0183296494 /NCGR_PEP_ID=MMETSP0160_2-20130417/4020_1 /TAXON_ID=2839 ORGANISM="Odontella Sinensis, Strain Grunow 1884" /NCGR_SAMPLE_ID=MMETSP0160_2 /ASSEMBLY_ACC=CAM_ASM_000250 /LENGTH=932 /DNA_ID=CAMNT_0025458113 /DNA_START=76 /DNA_END=2874 /DNA_ORIENTATION=+
MAPNDEKAVTLMGETEKKKDDAKGKKDGKGVDKPTEEAAMSEEDQELKERLETCVSTVINEDGEASVTVPLRLKALDVIVTELRTATSSMTSVPKPLKFLRPHFGKIKAHYTSLAGDEAVSDGEMLSLRARLADVLAVLAMTMGKPEERESLKFKLTAFKDYDQLKKRGEAPKVDDDNLGSWGHEFVRSLAGEIGQEYNTRVLDGADPESDVPFVDLLSMVDVIVPFHVSHNAEAEAVDLLIEVQRLKKLLDLDTIDENNYGRICLYLVKTADFMSDPDDYAEMLETAFELFRKQKQYFDALRVALRMGKDDAVSDLFSECTDDLLMKKQMCLLLARHRVNFEVEDDENEDDLNELIGNAQLSEQFLKLGQDLDVMDAKTPEDIYKSHLAETGGFSRRRDAGGANVDSARANLASTFVNAFVNAGFGQDKLMTPDNEWLYKNKDHGMMSATASLGSILLWNVEEGLTQIDKFLYSSEDYVKAGAALAVGILSSGVRNDADPALALLTEHVEGNNHTMKCAACTGLGIAYAGSAREEVMDLLLPVIESSEGGATNMLEVALAGLALGMIYVGKCDETAGSTIVQRLMEATEEELDQSHARFLCLGLGLLFLGRMEMADAMLEALRTVEHKIAKYAAVVLETCAYAGTGNVLKVQEMLHHCAEHSTEDAEHQMAAVIGIGLITMGEDVGSEMALRAFDHLLHYCELPVKRAVPLALAVLHISNPDFTVIDQLSRLSHDPDAEISQNAILAMGIVSAGTNNSRVAGLLRQLGEFYNKEAGHIFCVRISQGLLHMGKGLITLNPFHSDRMLMSGPALGGMLVLIHCCLDLKNTLLDKSHYLLYYLTCAMNPRMLITVNEDMSWRSVTVRVGQAVETVGQAGKPKTITGFQTHTTPVLLGAKERAELGTEEVLSVSSVLEGIVILKDNPDYEPEEGN